MNPTVPHHCPLCQAVGVWFFEQAWLQCPTCAGLFRPPHHFPAKDEERSRYEEHLNDVNDPRFQAFVAPIAERVQQEHTAQEHGLDFGSGTAPIVQHVLTEAGYDVAAYDPFFADRPDLLEGTYNFITCCEVIEHFHYPAVEFERLKGMLLPGGKLYCMTLLYHDGVDFSNWHYRRDDTHVFIYRKETIEWIARRFGFSGFEIQGRLILFER